jgi:hypothetical protein
MSKRLAVLATALVVVGSTLAYAQDGSRAQDSSRPRLSLADFNVLTDARIGILKSALQLTPEQAKYWPPVEEAIRARAEARYRRLAAIKDRAAQEGDVDVVGMLRNRADALAERAANLKKLVDAWQPLDQTLTPAQKERARVVAGLVVRQMRRAVDRSGMGTYDEDSDEG